MSRPNRPNQKMFQVTALPQPFVLEQNLGPPCSENRRACSYMHPGVGSGRLLHRPSPRSRRTRDDSDRDLHTDVMIECFADVPASAAISVFSEDSSFTLQGVHLWLRRIFMGSSQEQTDILELTFRIAGALQWHHDLFCYSFRLGLGSSRRCGGLGTHRSISTL